MSYTITVNRQCGRCPREERTEVSVEDVVKMAKTKEVPGAAALVVTIDGTIQGSFPYLCTQCRSIVNRYLEHALKMQKKESSLRERVTVAVEGGDEE